MTVKVPYPPVQTTLGQARGGERYRVLALAVGLVVLVAVYFGVRSSTPETGTLLPYQMLVRDLVAGDQATFEALRQTLLDAEGARAASGRWPDAPSLTRLPASNQAGGGSGALYSWRQQSQGVITHYVGLPAQDASAAAWMIAIREPEPGVPTDTAPNDEEHHRLPDGTVLHVSIWTHRFGGQLEPAFTAQPESAGWTEVLTAPLNPLAQPFGAVAPPK